VKESETLQWLLFVYYSNNSLQLQEHQSMKRQEAMGFEIDVEQTPPTMLELENPIGHQPNKTLMNKTQQYIENLIAEQEYQNPYLTKKVHAKYLQNVPFAECCSRGDKLFH